MGIFKKPVTRKEVVTLINGIEVGAGTGIPHVPNRSSLPSTAKQDELYYIENENKLVAFDINSNKFEETGLTVTELDLRYYLKSEVDALIAGIDTGDGSGTPVDAYTKSEIDSKLEDFVVDGTVYLKEETYTRSEVDALLTNAGVVDAYSKSETYTKTEVDTLIAGVDTGGGTAVDAYTKEETNTLLSGKMDFDNAYTKVDADWRFVINGSVYSKEEVDALIADSGSGTPTDVYTKSETDNLLANKSNTNHTHSEFSQLHTHSNKTVLDNLSDVSGTILYKGEPFLTGAGRKGSDATEVIKTIPAGGTTLIPADRNSVVDVRYLLDGVTNVSLVPQFKNANPTPSVYDSGINVSVNQSHSYDSATQGWRAFDLNNSYIWNSKIQVTPDTPVWLQIDFGIPKKVKTFDIYVSSGLQTRNPTAFQIQVSDDGINYSTLQSYSGLTWTNLAETQTFTINEGNRKFGRMYRLFFTENGGGGSIALNQVNLYGDIGERTTVPVDTEYSVSYDNDSKGYFVRNATTLDKKYSIVVEEPTKLNSYVPVKAVNVIDMGAKADATTDDYTAIQNALNKAESDGTEKVYFPKGIYLLNTGLVIPSNVTLEFEKGAILRRGLPFTTMMVVKADGVTGGYNAAKNIKLIGGRFEANTSDKMTTFAIGHASDIEIRGCEFDGNKDWHFLDICGSRRVKIINNRFLNYGTASSGTEAVQLDVFDPNQTGNYPFFGPYDGTACQDILIEQNYFESGNTAIGVHTAVVGSFHKNVKIINNMFISHRLEAITSLSISDLTIEGNYIDDALGGIKVYSIAGNTAVKNIKIRNNTLKNINRNTSSSRGIALYGLKNDSIIQDVVISDNYLETVGLHGITFDFCGYVVVRGNKVTGCGQTGIYCYGSSDALIEGNRLKGNSLTSSIRHDINIGYVTDLLGARNLVTNNHVETIGAYYSKDSVIERNYFTKVGSSVTDAGGNVNLITEFNRVATA